MKGSNKSSGALGERPEVQRLWASSQFTDAVATLTAKRHRRQPPWERPFDPAQWLTGAVIYALSEPDIAETMTASERRRAAANIKEATRKLRESLRPFHADTGFRWPFQGNFDALALEIAIDDEERWNVEGSEDREHAEQITHRTRFAIYHLLMNRMDWLFDTIDLSAEWFAETETVIKKPNDPNAKRLYFLRVITKKLVHQFGSPCRGVALNLASIYFPCDDLDEAAVSKLAPVVKQAPVQISPEHLEHVLAGLESMKERYLREGGDPARLDEDYGALNEMREKLRKIQPE